MEHHKQLYKENISITSVQRHKELNREIRNQSRAQRRENEYSMARNISVSPEASTPLGEKSSPNSERTDEIDTTSDNAKSTRKEDFVRRFVEWKMARTREKQTKLERDLHKPKPFISTVAPNTTQNVHLKNGTNSIKSFAPDGHQFKAPEGLKQCVPTMSEATTCNKKRQSIYTIVSTPKKITAKPTKKLKVGESSLAKTTLANRNPNQLIVTYSNNEENPPQIEVSTTIATTTKSKHMSTKPTGTIPKTYSNKPLNAERLKLTNVPKEKSATFKIPYTTKPQQITSQKNRLPAHQARFNFNVSTASGAVGKAAQSLQARRTETKEIPKNCRLGTNMKAKRGPPSQLKLTHQATKVITSKRVVETPTLTFPNPFGAFITSTSLKGTNSTSHVSASIQNQSPTELGKLGDTISPIETLPSNITTLMADPQCQSAATSSGSSSLAKRALLQNTATGSNQNATNHNRKFNFIQSAANELHILENILIFSPMNLTNNESKTESSFTTDNTAVRSQSPTSCNQIKDALPKRNFNVSHHQEMKECVVNPINCELNQVTPITAQSSILETAKHFRKQLSDEITRLEAICQHWENYRETNKKLLEATDGVDQINTAIGQTRLLISKKFKQFESLIERCELAAKGSAPKDDGSEATKHITAIDLEGFWSMLGLQLDDIKKRFECLERLKDNRWIDPEPDVNFKKRRSLSEGRIVRTKRKMKVNAVNNKPANRGLQQMMRQMYAKMKSQGNSKSDDNEIAVTISGATPPRRQSRRLTRQNAVIVRDRKVFSPAPTVVNVLSPKIRCTGGSPKPLPPTCLDTGSPKLLSAVKKMRHSINRMFSPMDGHQLRRSTLIGAVLKQQRSNISSTPSPTIARAISPSTPMRVQKSFLKTSSTGTNSKSRSVVFKDRVNFQLSSTESNIGDACCNIDQQNGHLMNSVETYDYDGNMNTPRSYQLRTRKVKLRPSCEIIIPK